MANIDPAANQLTDFHKKKQVQVFKLKILFTERCRVTYLNDVLVGLGRLVGFGLCIELRISILCHKTLRSRKQVKKTRNIHARIIRRHEIT